MFDGKLDRDRRAQRRGDPRDRRPGAFRDLALAGRLGVFARPPGRDPRSEEPGQRPGRGNPPAGPARVCPHGGGQGAGLDRGGWLPVRPPGAVLAAHWIPYHDRLAGKRGHSRPAFRRTGGGEHPDIRGHLLPGQPPGTRGRADSRLEPHPCAAGRADRLTVGLPLYIVRRC